jgi:signal transduction histidine kinase
MSGFSAAIVSSDDALPREVTTTVYRIVIEALTNVRRHAPAASQVTVSIQRTPATPGVEIVVCDDGRGAGSLPVGRRGGRGLIGLTQRVEDLGGTLTAGPDDPTGWRATAFLPLPRSGRRSRA